MLHSEATFHANPPANFDGRFFWDWLNKAFQEGTLARRFNDRLIDQALSLPNREVA